MTAATLLDRFRSLAEQSPDARAVAGSQPMSRADLMMLADDYDAQLREGGTGPGDLVVLSLHNSLAAAALPLAIWARGAVPVMVPPDAPVHHLQSAIEVAGASVVYRHDGDDLTIENPKPSGAPPRFPDMTDAGSVLFTSGSTGRPKGVVQTHATLLGCSDTLAGVIGYRDTDSLLAAVPWSHDYGWTQLLALYGAGVPLVLPEDRGLVALCAAIEHHSPTVFGGVPSLFALLTHGISNIRKTPTNSLRVLMSTGSHMPDAVLQGMRDLFPDAGVRLNFGLTETFRTTSLAPGDLMRKPGSSGQAMPGVQLRILDPDGNPVAPRQEGEIVHDGPGAFAGYLGDPDLSAAVRDGNGVKTGDIGWLDSDGYLFVTGRRDRQVKSMGLRVHLDEVERMLLTHPGILQAAVIAKPHPITGAQIAAAVVVDPDALPLPRDALPAHMRPRPLKKLTELPRRPNGKVDYPALADLL